MRVIVSSFLACSLTLGIASAAFALDKETTGQLADLEKKYFSHTFDNDSDQARVERLEKLVYGDVTEGTPEQRIKNMAQATFDPLAPDPSQVNSQPVTTAADQDETAAPPPSPASRSSKTASKSAPKATKQFAPQVPVDAPQQISRNAEPVDPDDDTSRTQYPRITAMEQVLLGKTYESDELGVRLSRLEVKAFGKESKLSDYGDRADDLDQYVVSKLHKEPVPTRNGDDDGSGTVVPVTSDQGTYPRVTALEQAILGKAHVGDPLADRLCRMEAKAFGEPSKNPDLGARTDKLEKYAETKLHKKLHDERTETANGGAGGKKIAGMMEKQALAMAANLLLGAAGVNNFGFGGIGMPSGLGPGMYNATNGGTMAGAIPMGGKRARAAQEQPQQNAAPEEREPENKKEDAVILSENPPPQNARLISKVGWCEMQTYGQTFTEMHLPARLVQLNDQYRIAPGKSGVELMDRINDIVKAVDSRRAPMRSAAKKPASPTE